jgi:tetratricopeptide (TPR) repeat protein
MWKIGWIVILIICSAVRAAPLKHAPQISANYLKYKQLTAQEPQNKDYLFELALNLAVMGRIEQAGATLKEIDRLDDNYARTTLKKLEAARHADPADWWVRFKLGFVYYFLYEEAQGRIELAERRIKRTQNNDPGESGRIISAEHAVIAERLPQASYYRTAALANFYAVASKTPDDYLNAWGYAYMAVVQALAKEWQEAKRLCELALKIEPNAYAIHAAYMETLRQTGNLPGAARELAKALSLKSEQEAYDKKVFNE